MLYAAASAETPRGWGGPLALLAAFVIFRVVVMPVSRWVMSKIGNPSPPPALPAGSRKKVQSTVGFTDDEPDRVRDYSWGRIGYERRREIAEEPEELPAGADPERPTRAERMRLLMAQARQVVTTGSSELPEEPDDELEYEPEKDPEIDLDLGYEPERETVNTLPKTKALEYITQSRDLMLPYRQIVGVIVDVYAVSESTAKRWIREVDEARRT